MKHVMEQFVSSKVAAGRKPATIKFYRRIITESSRYLAWPPNPDQVRSYLVHKRETCKEITVKSVYQGLASFLNWSEHEGLLKINPIARIDKPRPKRSLPKAVPMGTIKKLMQTIEAGVDDPLAIRDLALFRLAYDTGARVSELASMRLSDLDLETNGVMIVDGKGGNDRKVYFGRKCSSALATWLVIRPFNGEDSLFLNRLGQPFTRNGIYQALQKWCRLSKIKMTVHQIRHSYATHALRRGIDLGHIQHQMGHSDISVTAIYLLVEDEERRQAHLQKAPGDAI